MLITLRVAIIGSLIKPVKLECGDPQGVLLLSATQSTSSFSNWPLSGFHSLLLSSTWPHRLFKCTFSSEVSSTSVPGQQFVVRLALTDASTWHSLVCTPSACSLWGSRKLSIVRTFTLLAFSSSWLLLSGSFRRLA